ncbi:helix-turn-helix domain-containing protein [Streptomyces nitrosporeus]|uniref:helix-turn-helix domain-containing protein n=1 Tax=Streptomyces nitrosporeus TaxID=28894 RepID=UPI0019B16E94|nr:XRE family transcriptional regulator [Streptomyces nitrosporeus]GGZ08306.1 XRE family transcriptional regulator [Streptomyces nitrosporeus]
MSPTGPFAQPEETSTTLPPAGLPVPAPAGEAEPGRPPSSGGPVREALSVNLNRRRLAQGWSLREMSAATGISKALLSQIERGEANPTLDVVTRIATVLRADPVDLLRRSLREPEILRAGELDEPEGESAVNLLFATHGHSRFEVYRSRLHPHAQSQLSSHGTDSVEYVMVIAGRVTLVVDGTPYELHAGDSARFDGRAGHYYTTEDSPAVTHSIVGYPLT